MNIQRIIFLYDNNSFVKVGPHNSDPTKLVLKSNSTTAPYAFCKSFGLEPGEQWNGSVHAAIMPVDKAAFVASFANMSKALQTPALPENASCEQCGGADGSHWASCSNHPENKAKLN